MIELTLMDKLFNSLGIQTKKLQQYQEEKAMLAQKEAAKQAVIIQKAQENQKRTAIRRQLEDPSILNEDILHTALKSGDLIGVEESINAGVDLNKPAPTLPLTEALLYYVHSNADEGRALIGMLLKNGADIKAFAVDGKPVVCGIQNNYTIELMIQYKGIGTVREALNMIDKTGKTVGMNMIIYKRDARIIDQMLDVGLDLKAKDKNGDTIKDYLIDHQRNHLSPDYAFLLDKVEKLEKSTPY